MSRHPFLGSTHFKVLKHSAASCTTDMQILPSFLESTQVSPQARSHRRDLWIFFSPKTPSVGFLGHSWLGFFSSVLDQSVDVMLGAVLRRRDLEHEGDAEERLLGVAVCHSLERRSQE